MKQSEQPVFEKLLCEMECYFRDALTPRQRELYWLLLRDRLTWREWDYACEQAMVRETVSKVPLIAHLLDYVWEYRRAERGKRLEAEWTEAVASRKTLHAMHEGLGKHVSVERMVDQLFPKEH